MSMRIDRRGFMKLAAYGGAVFVSGCAGLGGGDGTQEDFFFVQLSDTHWGFKGPAVNPDPTGTLPKAIDAVNALPQAPDFIVFTGDLTHSTDDGDERRRRMAQVREQIGRLKVQDIRYLAGEHDAAPDRGAAFREYFGATSYSFDHKGVHFIALDNVSDPAAMLGDAQLQWLAEDLQRCDRGQRIVVLTHRPLFELAPSWDWTTRDGGKAIDLLMPFDHVTVFYGHIHQEHHHLTGHIAHHAAKGLMFALPAPLSVPRKAPVPWDAANPYRGLGFREVDGGPQLPVIAEMPVAA